MSIELVPSDTFGVLLVNRWEIGGTRKLASVGVGTDALGPSLATVYSGPVLQLAWLSALVTSAIDTRVMFELHPIASCRY
jgi:hypothetical protein